MYEIYMLINLNLINNLIILKYNIGVRNKLKKGIYMQNEVKSIQAIIDGHPDTVQDLLTKKIIDLNVVDGSGWTVLSFLVDKGDRQTVENILNNQWLSEKAGVDAANFIRKIGLENGTIAIEKAFLPADTYDSLQKELPNASFIDAAWALEELRVIKTPEELKKLKIASEKIVECMTDVMQTTLPGTSTYEIVETMRRKETEMGLSFEYCLTATGPSFNRAPSNAKWENGNIISLDSGGNLGGYLGDLCRMGVMGNPTPLMVELLDEIKSIQTAARANVRPGVTGEEIFESALEEQSKCTHKDQIIFVAHGMGMIQHEAPHLTSEGLVPYPGTYADRPLSTGMVLSVETDMKNPDVGFIKLEDTIVVTENGHEAYGDESRDWVINQN